MPKIVIYVRAEDARVIETTEQRPIELWVRALVRDEIAKWHARGRTPLKPGELPEPWARREKELKEGA